MISLVSRLKYFALLAVVVLGVVGCGVSGGDGTGRLSLSLTDKSGVGFDEVWVTIKEIAIHAADDPEDTWTTIAMTPATYDLMSLSGGVRQQLALVDLNPGHYTQMRLIIGTDPVAPLTRANFVVLKGDEPYAERIRELKIPSGIQTGIKLVQGFDINENNTTELTFDFEVAKSIVVAGKSGKYILKPTIHVLDTARVSNIHGTVTDNSSQDPLGDALISLQVFNAVADPALATPAQIRDQISQYSSTFTDDAGRYVFWWPIDPSIYPDGITFNVVATIAGYATGAEQILAKNGVAHEVNFLLDPATEGAAEITITGTGATAAAPVSVTLSIRRNITPVGATSPVVIEVKSIMVEVDKDPFILGDKIMLPLLPSGEVYSVVAWTNLKTVVVPFTELLATHTTSAPLGVAVAFPVI